MEAAWLEAVGGGGGGCAWWLERGTRLGGGAEEGEGGKKGEHERERGEGNLLMRTVWAEGGRGGLVTWATGDAVRSSWWQCCREGERA